MNKSPFNPLVADWGKVLPKKEPPRAVSGVAQPRRELVVGGDIKWKPVDRIAAKLLMKADHLSKPPSGWKPNIEQPKITKIMKTDVRGKQVDRTIEKLEKAGQKMPAEGWTQKKGEVSDKIAEYFQKVGQNQAATDAFIESQGEKVKTSVDGVRFVQVNGTEYVHIGDTHAWVCAEVRKLVKEVDPIVQSAADSRAIVAELLDGIGDDMDKFKQVASIGVNDIRQTRFAIVSEAGAMTKALSEIRQFFVGPDYEMEVKRLREFVELCERLQALKASGFLDRVADTMINLSVGKA